MKKFTLIEMLVVVAIIGILNSFLLPSLGKSRAKAKVAVCKSNMKQVHFALIMFQDDNDGYYPYSRTRNPRHLSWDDNLESYDGRNRATTAELEYPVLFKSKGHTSGAYACPDDDVQRSHWTGNDVLTASYSLTYRVVNRRGNLTGWARGVSGGNENAECQNVSAIAKPSETIEMVEFSSSGRLIGHGGNSLVDAGRFQNKFINHDGLYGANYTMIDGSVQSMTFWKTLMKEDGTMANPGWSIGSMWDSNR